MRQFDKIVIPTLPQGPDKILFVFARVAYENAPLRLLNLISGVHMALTLVRNLLDRIVKHPILVWFDISFQLTSFDHCLHGALGLLVCVVPRDPASAMLHEFVFCSDRHVEAVGALAPSNEPFDGATDGGLRLTVNRLPRRG
jgi:hypothetical protein